MNTFTRGVRNAFRNVVRTISIVAILGLSIGLSLVMIIAHQAVGQKITDVKASIGNTISISPAGFSNFSQANNTLTVSDLAKVKSLTHVTKLTETLSDHLATTGSAAFGPDGNTSTTSLKSPVTLNSSGKGPGIMIRTLDGKLPANFSLPIEVLGTTDPGSVNGNNLTIKSGQTLNGSKDTNDALISTDMANKNGLKVGSTFTAYGKTLKVVGIFDSGSRGGNNTVVMSLAALQRLSGQTNDVTSAVATVDSLDNLSGATTAVKGVLGSKADVTSSQEEADNTVKPLKNVQSISLVSLIGAVTAGAIIILLVMIMIVRERRREIGVLKAIGASNARVILQFMSEAVTLTLAGAVIGVLIGIAGGNPVTNTLVTNSSNAPDGKFSGGPMMSSGPGVHSFSARNTAGGNFLGRNANSLSNSVRNIQANVGWSILVYGLVAALSIAILGSAAASFFIAKVRPAEVMRTE